MAKVWQVADKHNLAIPFTNFLLFGPQSAGKTTLTERILGFPVGLVKQGCGTTRPMVLTTRWAEIEGRCKVKGSKDREFQVKDKREIMDWVTTQMAETGTIYNRPVISSERVYVEVSGPQYKNRRFVDLPGFQVVEEKGHEGTRKAILDLLRSEMENQNTVVLCVEDAWGDFNSSGLMTAFREVFGTDFAQQEDLTKRFVFCLNKSDAWFSQGVTTEAFLNKITAFSRSFGLVPILVGASVDTANSSLREGDSLDRFEKLEQQYHTAMDREDKLYQEVFSDKIKLETNLDQCLADKFRGFDHLLGTVDAMVVSRDKEQLEAMAQQLKTLLDSTSQSIKLSEGKYGLLTESDGKSLEKKTMMSLKTLVKYLKEIATADYGSVSAIVAADVDELKKHGNNALMEEMEFAFGDRKRKQPPYGEKVPFKGFYNPRSMYDMSDDAQFVDHPPSVTRAWQEQIFKTVERLQSKANSSMYSSISYLDTPLVGGALYDRAFAVWSSSVYRLVVPSADDLIRLPSTVGCDPEMQDPNRFDFKKAKRLAEIYIHRLTPAIHYLCQKMEFLLLQMFETAWRGILQTPETRELVEAIGVEAFKAEVRDRFQKAVKKRASITFNKCFSDLHNEVHKLLPYTDNGPSVAGMLSAYPELAKEMKKTKENFKSDVKVFSEAMTKKIFPGGFASSLLRGVSHGIEVISILGSVDPLLFVGLHIVKKILLPSISKLVNGDAAGGEPGGDHEVLAENRDHRLLGVAACLYAHFLPRFITTIDGRMRSDMLAFVNHVSLIADLEAGMVDADVIKCARERARQWGEQINRDKAMEADLAEAKQSLQDIGIKITETESTLHVDKQVSFLFSKEEGNSFGSSFRHLKPSNTAPVTSEDGMESRLPRHQSSTTGYRSPLGVADDDEDEGVTPKEIVGDSRDPLSIPLSKEAWEEAGWKKETDKQSGRPYYYNRRTKKSQWTRPSTGDDEC